MRASDPAAFYTGLVADLYSPLKSTSFDDKRYAELIDRYGEPALELGCGDGDPLLDLRAKRYDVDGVDSSPDMIDRLHRRAEGRGLDVTAWVAAMQTMSPPRRYRTIFLAGPTFNLLPDDQAMAQALVSIQNALTAQGTAIVPLFVPEPVASQSIGVPMRQETATGWMAWQIVAAHRDEQARSQTLKLRYEREDHGQLERTERHWILHWIDRDGFEDIARRAGLGLREAPGTIDHEAKDVVVSR